jgi:importin subunit alpha-6/7
MGKTVNYAIDAPHEIRKEALWCLSNIATTGTTQQVQALVQLGAIEAFCFNLEEGLSDPSMIMVILNAIDKILQVSLETGMDYLRIVDEYNGIDCIENLQEHPNDEVYNKAVYILENYFGGDEEEDENLAPDIIDGGYTFGVPKQLFPDTQAPAFDFGGSPMAFGESSTNNQTFEANFVTQV